MDRLLSPEEAAQRLSCRRTFVFELIKRGDLRSVKLGKLRRVPESAVVDFIARLEEAERTGTAA